MQLTVADTLKISQATANRCCRLVCDVLSSFAVARRFIRFPRHQEATEMKQRFGAIAGFPSVIGCIDGTHVPIRKPGENTEDYIGRKGASLNVQAVCDVDYKIRYLNATSTGRSHDARCWRNSCLKQKFETGIYQGFLLGDSGYPTSTHLLTPYINPENATQSNYNRALCRTRVLVEQTFGILKQRFQLLKTPIRGKPSRAGKYVVASVVCHNIGIDRHDIVDIPRIVPVFDPQIDHIARAQPDGKAMRNHIAITYFSV